LVFFFKEKLSFHSFLHPQDSLKKVTQDVTCFASFSVGDYYLWNTLLYLLLSRILIFIHTHIHVCIIALSALQNSPQVRQKLSLLSLQVHKRQCVAIGWSNTQGKPLMVFSVMPLYFMALLGPANVHEKTFNSSSFVYWYGYSLFGRNSPDIAEDKALFWSLSCNFQKLAN